VTAPSSRFSFGLQRVLDLRQQREQQIAGRLGTAAEAAAEARAAMEALALVRRASGADLAAAHVHATSVGALHQQERVLATLDQHLVIAAEEVAAREQQVEQVRTELNDAMQARRVISRLRERREDEWRLAHTRSERAAMDALAIERHAARQLDADPTGDAP